MAMILVYGTLMRDGHANSLLGDCEFVARGRVAGFTMVDLGSFPMAIESTHPNSHIWGDLFRLPSDEEKAKQIYARLCQYEGSLYYPEKVTVESHCSIIMDVPALMFVGHKAPTDQVRIASWSPQGRMFDGVDRRGAERLEMWGI